MGGGVDCRVGDLRGVWVYRLGRVEAVVTGDIWQHGHGRGSRTGIRQW